MKNIIATVAIGVFVLVLAPAPASALVCTLVETEDEWARRVCHYECDTGKKTVKVERQWYKCTPCRRGFTR